MEPHFNFKHGLSRKKIYGVWRQMLQRCYNAACKDYPAWGGRGIRVCDAWHDIHAFVAWSEQSGYCEGVTIERRDNSKNYCPENCHWVPNRLQGKNTRRQRMIEIGGRTMDASDWSRATGIHVQTILQRVRNKWPADRLLIKPVKGRNQFSQ